MRESDEEGVCVIKYLIRGGKPLNGTVEISGAKNAAVAIIPACLMVDGVCRIENVPMISDVTMLLRILQSMGGIVRMVNKSTVEIDCRPISEPRAESDMMRQIRASYYLIGAMLARFGESSVVMPGGCNFGGTRPIDQHVKGFTALGAKVELGNDRVVAKASTGRLHGANIYLDVVSVGATINVMLAASTALGITVIENAAKEPHIVDLANFLNSCGADIRGAGTNVIKVRGVRRLTGSTYAVIPDQIEAGTYMAAVAGTGGDVTITNVIPRHLECISGKLREMGVQVTNMGDAVRVVRDGPLRRANVKTMPYPGFPTDMQPQLSTILCLAKGTSVVSEGVWETRYKYVDELRRMGARIQVDGRIAIIEGVSRLTGATIRAYDLRAGAAMVIAGLCAEGSTTVEGVHYIERGYEDIVSKLRALGADIVSVTEDDPRETLRSAI